MPDTYVRYLLVDLERLMESMLYNERLLGSDLLPFARKRVVDLLSYQRKHFAGLAKVARMAGANDAMIKEVLTGKTETFNCPACETPMVDSPMFKDENGDSFLECPKCNKEHNFARYTLAMYLLCPPRRGLSTSALSVRWIACLRRLQQVTAGFTKLPPYLSSTMGLMSTLTALSAKEMSNDSRSKIDPIGSQALDP